GAGTSATQAFSQQFPQMAGAFGPWGVALGTAAAILVPLAGYFLSASQNADTMTASLERQKGVTDNLVASVTALRLEGDMLRQGTQTQEEQAALNENIRLMAERNVLEGERSALIAQANDAMGVINQSALDAINLRIQEIDASRASNSQLLENIATEREKVRVQEGSNALAEKMREIMAELGNMNLNGPWNSVLGSIQTAINKAREYRAAAAADMGATGGAGPGRGASPGGPLIGSADHAALVAGGGVIRPMSPVGASRGGGGGGGGSGGSSEIESLRASLMTKEEVELESYTRRQEALQAALDQRMITEEEFRQLSEVAQQQHADKMTQIDAYRYGTGLAK
ncbi:MAG: hypothetical protein EAZ40_04195, partial [Rhodobacterales bacterium]